MVQSIFEEHDGSQVVIIIYLFIYFTFVEALRETDKLIKHFTNARLLFVCLISTFVYLFVLISIVCLVGDAHGL